MSRAREKEKNNTPATRVTTAAWRIEKKSFIVTSHEPSIDPHNSEKGEDLVVEDSRGQEGTRVS
jgi:hypothetical protein